MSVAEIFQWIKSINFVNFCTRKFRTRNNNNIIFVHACILIQVNYFRVIMVLLQNPFQCVCLWPHALPKHRQTKGQKATEMLQEVGNNTYTDRSAKHIAQQNLSSNMTVGDNLVLRTG